MKMMFKVAIVMAVLGQLTSAATPEVSTLTSASTEFSKRLYHNIVGKISNAVYSPFSIHSALTMTSLGARGKTLTEMRDTLGITSLGDSVHETYKQIIQELNNASDATILTANGIFVDPYYPVKNTFVDDAAQNYFATADLIDFDADGGPEEPINQYVEDKTKGVVKNMLTKGSINDYAVSVLVNTLFFNGTWEKPFQTSSTKIQSFRIYDGYSNQVTMMHDERIIRIKRDFPNGVDVAELLFKGGRFGLYVVLPTIIDDSFVIDRLLNKPGETQKLFTGLQSVYVKLAIPKFKIETSVKLKSTLKSLGIVMAFEQRLLDFKGLSQKDGVYITDVFHRAMIELNESGTVAAAATTVSTQVTSELLPPTESFIADRPFVYFLRDIETGQILLQGMFSG